MICIYPILMFSLGTSRWEILLWSFTVGLLEDIFSNTPGMSAATLTLIGMLQPHILRFFSQKDEDDKDFDLIPSVRSMGWNSFIRYIITSVLIQEIAFFTLEAFSFFNYIKYGINIISSFIMTVLILLAFESIRMGAKKGNVR